MDVCGGCPTKCDGRRRHATTGNATTSRRMRGKRGERHQWTRGDGASIGRGCAFRGRGRVERMTGGGINATTSTESRALPSRDLAATALVLAAEASAALIADDADGGNIGVAIVGSTSLAAGGGVLN